MASPESFLIKSLQNHRHKPYLHNLPCQVIKTNGNSLMKHHTLDSSIIDTDLNLVGLKFEGGNIIAISEEE